MSLKSAQCLNVVYAPLLINISLFSFAGKRRQEQAADYMFLGNRMRQELLVKKKECVIESRHLAPEESCLYWEKERTCAKIKLREKEVDRMAEELA